MTVEQLIRKLKDSDLYAEHDCGNEFKIAEAILFDGTKPFPSEALEVQKRLKEDFEKRELDLKKKKELASKRAQTTAKAVNIGKMIEKILPMTKGFNWELADCRFLGEPIDFLTFNGFTEGNIKSLSFVEVKSGNARLNQHQKSIKDAIEDKRVSYQEFK